MCEKNNQYTYNVMVTIKCYWGFMPLFEIDNTNNNEYVDVQNILLSKCKILTSLNRIGWGHDMVSRVTFEIIAMILELYQCHIRLEIGYNVIHILGQ